MLCFTDAKLFPYIIISYIVKQFGISHVYQSSTKTIDKSDQMTIDKNHHTISFVIDWQNAPI